LGQQLDQRYQEWVNARGQVIGVLKMLLRSTLELSMAINEAKADLRLPFRVWCARYCSKFNVAITEAVCDVGARTVQTNGHVETWQLRRLGIVSSVHHVDRPVRHTRRRRPLTWLTYVNRTHEELGKLFERAGGPQKLPSDERTAISRQIASFNNLARKLQQ
jgi:hypothetical protein